MSTEARATEVKADEPINQPAAGAAELDGVGAFGGAGAIGFDPTAGAPLGAMDVRRLVALQRVAGNGAVTGLVGSGHGTRHGRTVGAHRAAGRAGVDPAFVRRLAASNAGAVPGTTSGPAAAAGPATLDAGAGGAGAAHGGEVAIQRETAAANAPVDPSVQREPTVQREGPAPAKFTVEGEEVKLAEFGKLNYVTGDVKFKTEGTAEVVGKDGKAPPAQGGASSGGGGGVKVDVNLGQQKVKQEIFGGWGIKEVKEKVTFEVARKKVELSLGVEAPIVHEGISALKGVAEAKFVGISADLDKLRKNPDDITVAGVKVGGGASGEVMLDYDAETKLKVKVKATVTGTIKPNMPRIAAEVAKQAATGAAKGAAEGTVAGEAGAAAAAALPMDAAALASGVAAIAVPLAAAAAIGYGFFQGVKNTKAAVEGAQQGVAARDKARTAAKGYAKTMTGSAAGSDEGSAAAETQITGLMASAHATREDVIAAVKTQKGGYQAIYDAEYKKLQDYLYNQAVQAFEDSHKGQYGWIEELGEDWGMRGVFRKNLRMVLYAD